MSDVSAVGAAKGNGSGPAVADLGLFVVGHVRGILKASNWRQDEEGRRVRSDVDNLLEAGVDVGGMNAVRVRYWQADGDGVELPVVKAMKEALADGGVYRISVHKTGYGTLMVPDADAVVRVGR